MKLAQQFLFRREFEVAIHETNRKEKGLIVAFEIGEDLNHPVYHSSSETIVDLGMVHQTIGSVVL